MLPVGNAAAPVRQEFNNVLKCRCTGAARVQHVVEMPGKCAATLFCFGKRPATLQQHFSVLGSARQPCGSTSTTC